MYKMSTIEEIETAIESLPKADYARLREWFSERDWKIWDKQIEADADSGKLDFLVREALEEKAEGNLMHRTTNVITAPFFTHFSF